MSRKKIIFVLFLVICALMTFALKQCTIYKVHKSGKHYIEYSSCGIINKTYFHSEINSYVGTLEERDDKYILTVVDTATEKKYILMSDEPIRIKGGDINIKKNN